MATVIYNGHYQKENNRQVNGWDVPGAWTGITTDTDWSAYSGSELYNKLFDGPTSQNDWYTSTDDHQYLGNRTQTVKNGYYPNTGYCQKYTITPSSGESVNKLKIYQPFIYLSETGAGTSTIKLVVSETDPISMNYSDYGSPACDGNRPDTNIGSSSFSKTFAAASHVPTSQEKGDTLTINLTKNITSTTSVYIYFYVDGSSHRDFYTISSIYGSNKDISGINVFGYNVSFDPNGITSSNIPGNQTGITTLPTTKPTGSSTVSTTFTASFDKNGGSGSNPQSRSATRVVTKTWKLSSWNTNANGTGTSYAPGSTISSNLTLYAIWTEKTSTTTTNATITLPTYSGTKTYYSNNGWSTSSTATSGTAAGTSVNLTSNVTYYVAWVHQAFSNNSYTISQSGLGASVTSNWDSDITVKQGSTVLGTVKPGKSGTFDLSGYVKNRGDNEIILTLVCGDKQTTEKVVIKIPQLAKPGISLSSTNVLWGDSFDCTLTNKSTIDNTLTFTLTDSSDSKNSLTKPSQTLKTQTTYKHSINSNTEISKGSTYVAKTVATDTYSALLKTNNGNKDIEGTTFTQNSVNVSIQLPLASTLSSNKTNVYEIDGSTNNSITLTITNSVTSQELVHELTYNHSGISTPVKLIDKVATRNWPLQPNSAFYGRVVTFSLTTYYKGRKCGNTGTLDVYYVKTPTNRKYSQIDLQLPSGQNVVALPTILYRSGVIREVLCGEDVINDYSIIQDGSTGYNIVINTPGYIGQLISILFNVDGDAQQAFRALDKMTMDVSNPNEFDIYVQVEKGESSDDRYYVYPIRNNLQAIHANESLTARNIRFSSQEEDASEAKFNIYFDVNKTLSKKDSFKVTLDGICIAPDAVMNVCYDVNSSELTKQFKDFGDSVPIGTRASVRLWNSNSANKLYGDQDIHYMFADDTYKQNEDGTWNTPTPDMLTNYLPSDSSTMDLDYDVLLKALSIQFSKYTHPATEKDYILFDETADSVSLTLFYYADADDRVPVKVYRRQVIFQVREHKFEVENENESSKTFVTGGTTTFKLTNADWKYLTLKDIKYTYSTYYSVPDYTLSSKRRYLDEFNVGTVDKPVDSFPTGLCPYITDISNDYVGKDGWIEFDVVMPGDNKGKDQETAQRFEKFFYAEDGKKIKSFESTLEWKFEFVRQQNSRASAVASETYAYGIIEMDPNVYGFKCYDKDKNIAEFYKLFVTVDEQKCVTFDFHPQDDGNSGVRSSYQSQYVKGYVNFGPFMNDPDTGTEVENRSLSYSIIDGDTSKVEQHNGPEPANDYSEEERIIKSYTLPDNKYWFDLFIIDDRGIETKFSGWFRISHVGQILSLNLQRMSYDEDGILVPDSYSTDVYISYKVELGSYNSKPVQLWMRYGVFDAAYTAVKPKWQMVAEGTNYSLDRNIIDLTDPFKPILVHPFPAYNTKFRAELKITDQDGNQLVTKLNETIDPFYRMKQIDPVEVRGILPIDNGWKEICVSDNYEDEYILGYYYGQKFFYDRIFSEITGEVSYENEIEEKKKSKSYMYLDKHTNYVYYYNGQSFVPYSTKITPFQKEIVAKNILRGVTPYLNKEDSFDYNILHTSLTNDVDSLQEVQTISTNVYKFGINTQDLGSDSIDVPTYPIIEVNENETVQLYRTAQVEDQVFHICSYEAYLNTERRHVVDSSTKNNAEGQITSYGVIEANSTYTLGKNEFVIFYCKQDSDSEYYQAYFFGEGTIIKSNNKSLLSTYAADEGLNKVSSFVRGNARGRQQYNVFITDYAMISEVAALTSKIGSTWSVSVMKENCDKLEDVINYCYWITNTTSVDGEYLLPLTIVQDSTKQFKDENNREYEYILKEGEFFIYTDDTQSLLNIRGAGTRISVEIAEGNKQYSENLVVEKQTIANINRYGIAALENKWYEFHRDRYPVISVEAQDFINIGAHGTVSFTIPDQGDEATKGVFFINRDGMFQLQIDAPETLNALSPNLYDVIYNQDTFTKLENLHGFKITYKNAGETAQFVNNYDRNTDWKIRTYLSVNVTSKTKQKFTDPGENTLYEFEFKSFKAPVDEDGNVSTAKIRLNSDNFVDGDIYLQCDSDVYCNGGENIPISTQIIRGAERYPSMYMYQKSSLNVESDYFNAKDYGEVINIELLNEVHDEIVCDAKLLKGNYILPVQNYNGENIRNSVTGERFNSAIKTLSISFIPNDAESEPIELVDFLTKTSNMAMRKTHFLQFNNEGLGLGMMTGKLAITMERNDWNKITYDMHASSKLKDGPNKNDAYYGQYDKAINGNGSDWEDNKIPPQMGQWEVDSNGKHVGFMDLGPFQVDSKSPIKIYYSDGSVNEDGSTKEIPLNFPYEISSTGMVRVTSTNGIEEPLLIVYYLKKGFEPINIQLLNLKKYSLNEEIVPYDVDKYLMKYDDENEFNYLVDIDEGVVIPNPLVSTSFNNYNHAYNEFTICQAKQPQTTIQQ